MRGDNNNYNKINYNNQYIDQENPNFGTKYISNNHGATSKSNNLSKNRTHSSKPLDRKNENSSK